MNIKIESWSGHDIRVIEVGDNEYRAIEDVALAMGYVPINECLMPREVIMETLPIGDEYFALTNMDRLLFVSHFYADTEYIQLANVARDVDDILNPRNNDVLYELKIKQAKEFVNCVKKVMFDQILSREKLINLLLKDIRMPSELLEKLIAKVNLKAIIENEIEEIINESKIKTIETRDDISLCDVDKNTKVAGVYLIKADNGLTKIGYSNNVNARFVDINVTSPCELSLVAVIETSNKELLEHELHEIFEVKRVKGEWFYLSDDDINWICKKYAIGK